MWPAYLKMKTILQGGLSGITSFKTILKKISKVLDGAIFVLFWIKC